MKFCRPIFRLIDKVNPELAKKTFKQHASFYVSCPFPLLVPPNVLWLIWQHPIARRMIARDLGVETD